MPPAPEMDCNSEFETFLSEQGLSDHEAMLAMEILNGLKDHTNTISRDHTEGVPWERKKEIYKLVENWFHQHQKSEQ